MTNIRLVICFLGTITLACVCFDGYLAARQVPIPDVLVAVPSGSLGSLGMLLTQRSARRPAGPRNEGQSPIA